MADAVVPIHAGRLTNIYLVRGRERSLLVDAGPPGAEGHVLEQMANHGAASNAVSLILISHGHTDHYGCAAALRERTGAPVAVHALDADALQRGIHQPRSLQPANRLGRLYSRVSFLRNLAAPDHAPPLEPDLVFKQPFRLDKYGVAGQVLLTPGHTPGAISVRLDTGEAIVGDLVMGTLRSRLRKPGPGLAFAWDLERNRRSLRHLLDLSPRILYVGHGGPFQPEDVQAICL